MLNHTFTLQSSSISLRDRDYHNYYQVSRSIVNHIGTLLKVCRHHGILMFYLLLILNKWNVACYGVLKTQGNNIWWFTLLVNKRRQYSHMFSQNSHKTMTVSVLTLYTFGFRRLSVKQLLGHRGLSKIVCVCDEIPVDNSCLDFIPTYLRVIYFRFLSFLVWRNVLPVFYITLIEGHELVRYKTVA